MEAIWTVDLWGLVPATALLFAMEHLVLSGLAEHYPWARLSKPQSYTLGVGTLFGLFLVHALANGRLETWAAFAILTLVAGVTVRVLWVVNPRAAQLEQPRSVALTNSHYSREHVLAFMENIAALLAGIQTSQESSREYADLLFSYFEIMRRNPEIDPDIPVAVIRKRMAKMVAALRTEE